MMLSKYISYKEAVKSSYATRNGLDNNPAEPQLQNITALCALVLDRIREYYGKPIIVNSIYRSPIVNTGIGGSKTSEHQALNKSAACDFTVSGVPLKAVFEDIIHDKIEGLQYNQVIFEFSEWIHISFKREGVNAMTKLIATKQNGKTVYRGA